MQANTFAIAGPIEFVPHLFGDPRGVFYETFSARLLHELGLPAGLEWVQDNQSKSQPGVLRGLHFQQPPHAQAKLVRVAKGRALDVIVDIRRASPTYGQHLALELTEATGNMLFIPAGFAHGFTALEEDTLFIYKCSDYYAPATEGGLRWNDPALGIDWGVENPLISPKDAVLPTLAELNSPF